MLDRSRTLYGDPQILHQAKDHHSTLLHNSMRQGEEAAKRIDASDTPTKNYKSVMKGIFMEELQNSLQDYNKRKLNLSESKKNFSNSYLQDCERNRQKLDNSELNRKKYYEQISTVQQDRAGRFIDNEKLHQHKIDTYVQGQLDPQRFHHFQEKYDRAKSQAKEQYIRTLKQQKHEKEQLRLNEQTNKENEQSKRFKMMDNLSRLTNLERQSHQEEKNMYRKELDRLLESKGVSNHQQKSSFYEPPPRHNPITNPIDGHVDNPYFVRKLGHRLQL